MIRLTALITRIAGWLRALPAPPADTPVAQEAPPAAAPQAPGVAKARKAKSKNAPKAQAIPSAPRCPHCKKTMVLKVARSGARAGGDFWGCVDYPKCRGIRAIFTPIKVD
jgi:restriction system protein